MVSRTRGTGRNTGPKYPQVSHQIEIGNRIAFQFCYLEIAMVLASGWATCPLATTQAGGMCRARRRQRDWRVYDPQPEDNTATAQR